MESIQQQVSSRNWGHSAVTWPLPQVHALAQCHSDLSSLDCKLCFSQGRVKLPRCLPSTAARIFLDGCFLRYDNYSFLHESIDPKYDNVNCSHPTGVLIDSSLHMDFRKRDCLVKAGSQLKGCAPGAQGQALFTGCYMRYSTERFFNTSSEAADQHGTKAGIIAAIALAAAAFIVLASFGAFIGYERLSKRREKQNNIRGLSTRSNLNFKYEVLEKATNFFSNEMKLGQGGAGSVFKGNLPDGRTLHIEGPESLLVYEYVPNRSLDQILFMNNTIHILSWQQRYNIILGTAEGLAYLHGGSGVKIIHRDIKTSNILLDEMLTPKIADFGLARCFATDNTHISTGIAGTLGYMAPEYLIRGQLTEKADVYGFGVLVLEISTGKKNSIYSQGSNSILHSVWKHYKAKTVALAIDPRLTDRHPGKDAENVLQIGLLCTQASASLRPSMAEVVQMLTNREYEIPSPKQPPFLNASVLSADDSTPNSITKVSLTKSSSMTINRQVLTRLPSYGTQDSFVKASLRWKCFSRKV
ncbi:hypothetical protein GH714_040692 [Hevea brasiliensis]|uniref:Protein kinase domain-containing protein n=1 Tax=Hevea brasiliensis TaxID=3981 RepID=A0A6A6MSA2_HEVBR|nr:hypothetical protein GH714_040692 [Hevea brasiliensis]